MKIYNLSEPYLSTIMYFYKQYRTGNLEEFYRIGPESYKNVYKEIMSLRGMK